MSIVYQKAFDHIDANSRPMQFIDRHLLHHQAAEEAQREATDEGNRIARSSPLAMHAQSITQTQSTSALQPPTHTGVTHSLPVLQQSLAPPSMASLPNQPPQSFANQSFPSQPFRAGLAQYSKAGNATPSPLQRLGGQQAGSSTTMPKPTSVLGMSSSADSTPHSAVLPAAVVPTGHGVSTWIQQQPSSSVPIVTQSIVNAPVPMMTAHHVSATPSAKIVIPMQATATAFTTQDGQEKEVLKSAVGEEARSGSTGAPQILKKHKRRHAKKVKARPSTCGCC